MVAIAGTKAFRELAFISEGRLGSFISSQPFRRGDSAGLSAAVPAAAQTPAGVLDCKVAGGVGIIIASTAALACVHHRVHGRPDFIRARFPMSVLISA